MSDNTYTAMALTQTVVVYAALLPDPVALLDATDRRTCDDATLRLQTAVALSAIVGAGLSLMSREWGPFVVTALTSLLLGVGADTLIRTQLSDRITP